MSSGTLFRDQPTAELPPENGYIELYRAHFTALSRRCPGIMLPLLIHIESRTRSAPKPKPEFADIKMGEWQALTGATVRTIETALAKAEQMKYVSREHPGHHHNRGGYKLNPERFGEQPLPLPRTCQAREEPLTASHTAPVSIAALRTSGQPQLTAVTPQAAGAAIPFDLSLIPDEIIFAEATRRQPQLTALWQERRMAADSPGPQKTALLRMAQPAAEASQAQAAAHTGMAHAAAVGAQLPAHGAQPTAEYSAANCPLEQDCPLFKKQKQETVPSSSSVGNATGTTTTEPVTPPDPVEERRIQVRNAARQYSAVDPAGIDQLLKACAPHDTYDICAGIHDRGQLAKTKKNPFGFLLTAVPNWLKDPDNLRKTQPPPAELAIERCALCGNSGFPGAECHTLGEARLLVAQGAKLCDCETGAHWRRMLE
jgi:hypothetical protein